MDILSYILAKKSAQSAIDVVQANLDQEVLERIAGDENLQGQIQRIEERSDVVDIVNTHDDLGAYAEDITVNDIVKVLVDSTHDDAISYYRYNGAELPNIEAWNYVGSIESYYTKAQTDRIAEVLATNLTLAYSTDEDYEPGAFVVYNDVLYKCLEATTGVWDADKWEAYTIISIIDDSVATITTAEGALATNFAPLFNKDKIGGYTIGDFVIYNYNLYQCKEDTSGEWDPSKWVEVYVVSLLAAEEARASSAEARIAEHADNIEADLTAHKTSQTAHSDIRTAISAEVTARTNDVTEINGKIININSDINTINSNISGINDNINEIESSIQELDTKVDDTAAYLESTIATTAEQTYNTAVADAVSQAHTDIAEQIEETAGQLRGEISDSETRSRNLINTEADRAKAEERVLKGLIDSIELRSAVVDVVADLAALAAYDTSKLGPEDLLEVLIDSDHENRVAYYRYNSDTEEFSYVANIEAYYTKAEADSITQGLQTAIDSEETARQNEITRVEGLISTEATTRANADTQINNRIDALDYSNALTSYETISTITQVDGLISANKQDIQIAQSQVTDLPEKLAAIDAIVPNTATSTNKLTDVAFVNDAINAVAAYYITYNAAGDAFPTNAALMAAEVVYSGGEVRTPTRNDYCIVLADEAHRAQGAATDPTTRYTYQNNG